MMRALGLCLLLAIVPVSGVHFPTKFARNSMSTSSFTTHGGLDEKKCLDIIARVQKTSRNLKDSLLRSQSDLLYRISEMFPATKNILS